MNYKSLLYEINNAAMASSTVETIVVPSNKQLYEVNLDTRTIDAPEVLSIQSEHYAETVYFVVDRYYDNMDLAQTNCVVQYVTNTGSYVYSVPFCDVTTYSAGTIKDGQLIDSTPKIIIPWSISISATEQAGPIKFFLRFYLMDDTSVYDTQGNYHPEDAKFLYSLSTLVAESKILKTLSQEDFVKEDEDFQVPERFFELMNVVAQMVDNATIYWNEV